MGKQSSDKNKEHYEKVYANYGIGNTLYWINNLDEFLDSATTTETSWNALYKGDLRSRLAGKKVFELGCGNCVNAAVMAALGAEVYANDIADSSGEIINKLNECYDFKNPIKFISGDFLENQLEPNYFDFVVGKAFLHHLDIPLEKEFLYKTARLLKEKGEARFFEPAVNSLLLDELRWYIPVKGRPSKLKFKEFRKWKEMDPHPERTFSSLHFEKVGKEYFDEVEIFPIGTIERFSRIMKWGSRRNSFKKWALRNERHLPKYINRSFARSQLVLYKKPRKI